MGTALLLTCVLLTIACVYAKSYTVDYCETNITLYENDCRASISELLQLTYDGQFSYFFREIQDRMTFGQATIPRGSLTATSLTPGVTIQTSSVYIARDDTYGHYQLGFTFVNTTALGRTRFLMQYDIYGAMAAVGSTNQVRWNYNFIQSLRAAKTRLIIPQSWANNIAATDFVVNATFGAVVDQTNTSLTISATMLPAAMNDDIYYSIPVQNPNCGYGSTVNIGLIVGVTVGGVAVIVIILMFFILLHVIVKWNKKRKHILLPVTATTVTATPTPATVVSTAQPVSPALLPTTPEPNVTAQTSQVNLLVI